MSNQINKKMTIFVLFIYYLLFKQTKNVIKPLMKKKNNNNNNTEYNLEKCHEKLILKKEQADWK